MIFTSFDYIIFLLSVFTLYWVVPVRSFQNSILLIGSYFFYGYVHPWFCFLIATSTIVDYFCGRRIRESEKHKKFFLVLSLVTNLGMLGFFKYFNFFTDNVYFLLNSLGLSVSPLMLEILLPVGISFYTFQTLSYTIDIYRGEIEPHESFIDFALFVAFFPQLVAGPIERAKRFLPQIAASRTWCFERFCAAFPLLIFGFFKKLVVADNMAIYVDKVYMLQQPTKLVLLAGTLAFALQILADFSAYTDIARGSARLLGFELTKNFNAPYLAISPSDFWRRWHISFSSWIRDYLYIPLGGSRVNRFGTFMLVALTSMGLSGLWHGAAWNFVTWGIYHAILLIAYHALGLGGRWQPKNFALLLISWCLMFVFTILGWGIFRTTSLSWLIDVVLRAPIGLSVEKLVPAFVIFASVCLYAAPLLAHYLVEKFAPSVTFLKVIAYSAILMGIVVFGSDGGQDFIYFQF